MNVNSLAKHFAGCESYDKAADFNLQHAIKAARVKPGKCQPSIKYLFFFLSWKVQKVFENFFFGIIFTPRRKRRKLVTSKLYFSPFL